MAEKYTGMFFAVLCGMVFTWQGLNLVFNPTGWLLRHGREVNRKHIQASRLIGWALLAATLVILLGFLRNLRGF